MVTKNYIVNGKNVLVIATIVSLLITGCASESVKLGITEEEWSSYSADKKQRLLANYKEITSKYENSAYIGEEETNTTKSTFLEISIHDGQVMMPPFNNWQFYQPVKFVICKDQCRNIILQQATDKKIQTELGVCYLNNVLYLDPSHYDLTKKAGSISINFSPIWLSGFAYKGINSSGYACLNDVTIEITQK